MQKGSDVVGSKESVVQDGSFIVGVDTTEYHRDGSSDTIHQDAHLSFGSVRAGAITGVTHNTAEGKSTNEKKG